MMHASKRTSQHREHDREERDQKRRPATYIKESSSVDELVVYRILCPDKVIGSVIGKNGKVINSIRQQTNAKVKVVDPYPGADKRVILVYCYVKHRDLKHKDIDIDDDDREPVCPAQNALLKVHDAIVDALAINSDSEDEEANVLVPASQAASVIGKSGAVIKRLRSISKSFIKVRPKDPSEATHSCAMSFDNFVQITGDARAVKKALFAVSTIIYKCPSKENIPLETSIQELPPTIILPTELPVYPASNLYSVPDAAMPSGHPSLAILGATRHGSHAPEFTVPADVHGRLPIYQSMVPAISTYNTPKCSGELLLRVVCPGDKIGLVIGKGGVTIKSIRKESGARIEVDDAKNDREESIITIESNSRAHSQTNSQTPHSTSSSSRSLLQLATMPAVAKTTAAKPKAAAAGPSHPSYFEMIKEAIAALKDRTGSSSVAIAKYIEEKHGKSLPANFKKMLSVQLRGSAAKGKLVKVKASYKLSDAAKKDSTKAKAAPKPKKKDAAAKPKKAAATAKPKKAAATAKPKKAAAKPKAPAAAGTKRKAPEKKLVAKAKKSPAGKAKANPKTVKSPAAKKARKVAAA